MYYPNKMNGQSQYNQCSQQTINRYTVNKMLISNVCELDELPFLKRPYYKWIGEQQQGQKSKIRLLQNLRSISYQCSQLMSKIFNCQKQVKKDTSAVNDTQQDHKQVSSYYEQLVITTQKQILSLQKFFYLINQLLTQQQFSHMVSNINKFINKCKIYIKDIVCSKYQIDFGMKQFLKFNVYLQKSSPDSLTFKKQTNKNIFDQFISKGNKFYIKCQINNFNFQPFKELIESKAIKPEAFIINNNLINQRLLNIYLQLSEVNLSIKPKDIRKYLQSFDAVSYYVDEQYLKLQVFKNYPLLRSKYYLPIIFNDRITGQRLDGPIFSNSDPDCMFSHFIGYNADRIKDLQGNNCQQCRTYIQSVQQNQILTYLRDNLYNPYKTDVLYCPQFNRFKLIMKTPVNKDNLQNVQEQQEQENKPQFKTQIKYLNYLHMRSTIKKIYIKKRNKFNDMLQYQKFSLSFTLWGRKMLIMDPVRGKNCSHYEFTDLRMYYLNKVTQTTFKCPICNDIMSDNDILYLKEVQIIIKYLRYKCSKFKQLMVTGYCYINHRQNKLFLQYKRRNKQSSHLIQTDIIEIKNYYTTLIDPYVSFNEYTLGIPDKYQQKLKEKYIFGFDKQNEQKDSDQDFEYKDIDIQDLINEKKQQNSNKNKTKHQIQTNQEDKQQ